MYSDPIYSKPQDAATGLYYYGYRFYDPTTGRWISRDPLGERGGVNVFEMIFNDSVNQIDILGLTPPTGGSGTNYRPDPFGHGKTAEGAPIDPHVDAIDKKGNKQRYNPDGSGRDGAGKVPKKDQGAFDKALKKLNDILEKCPKLPPGGIPSFFLPMPPDFMLRDYFGLPPQGGGGGISA